MIVNLRAYAHILIAAALVLPFMGIVVGCGSSDSSELSPTAPTGTSAVPEKSSAPEVVDGVPSDFAGVVWLHTNVSGWAETGNLRSVTVAGGAISLDYDKAKVWPGKNHSGANVNANPWIFVNVGGTWHAGTFEWFRTGQTAKPVKTVNGDHIQQSPLNRFRPKSGERYGFMVSGLARDSARNVQERTQVVMYTWP